MAGMICTRCGHDGKPRRHVKGSIWIEIVLWMLFIVPGFIYSLWRLSSSRRVCASCGSEDLVPLDSPVGRKLLQSFDGPAA